MENFLDDDMFHSDLDSLIMHLELDDNINDLDDDWSIRVEMCDLEPVEEITAEWITERIDDERLPEEPDGTIHHAKKILNENIDFKKINELMPKLYYGNGTYQVITKKDLAEYLS